MFISFAAEAYKLNDRQNVTCVYFYVLSHGNAL
jgi:hypothetical protein